MKKVYMLIITILVFAGLLSAFEKHMGQENKDCPGMMKERFEQKQDKGGMFMHMAEELELTDAQIETMQELRMDHKKYMILKKAEIEILMLDKKEAMKNKEFADAKDITNSIFEMKQEIALKKIDLHEEQWNMLTEEQKLKADEMDFKGKHSPQGKQEHHGMRKGM